MTGAAKSIRDASAPLASYLVHACAEAGVIDPAVDVLLFFFFDGALEPATRSVEVAGI